jgi:thiamine biosynthesis lipoprotein ApbE
VALEPAPGREGWPLTFGVPERGDDAVLVRLVARRLALSASGTRKGEHIVDPSTGRAVSRRAVWVALPAPARPAETSHAWPHSLLEARPATAAEGLSTAFMVLSIDAIRELCRRIPGVEAWLATNAEEAEGAPSLLHLS